MTQPLISIIIPAKNSEGTLQQCLDSVFCLCSPDFEVIVVDDGSQDRTGAIARSFPKVHVLRTAGVGPSAARNLAVAKARGTLIAFTDADCLVSANWLEELKKGFVNDQVAGVGGVQKSPEDEHAFALQVNRFLAMFGSFTNYMQKSDSVREVTHNASCNVIYRKAVYEELGGLWEGFWPGEDLDFDYRLRRRGYVLMMTPHAVVYHYRTKTVQGFGNMMFRYGWAQGRLVKKYGIFRLVQGIPLLMLGMLGLMVLGLLTFPLQTLLTILIVLGGVWGWLRFDGLLFMFFWTTFFLWQGGFLKGLVTR